MCSRLFDDAVQSIFLFLFVFSSYFQFHHHIGVISSYTNSVTQKKRIFTVFHSGIQEENCFYFLTHIQFTPSYTTPPMSIAIATEMSGANCQSPSAKNILTWKKRHWIGCALLNTNFISLQGTF